MKFIELAHIIEVYTEQTVVVPPLYPHHSVIIALILYTLKCPGNDDSHCVCMVCLQASEPAMVEPTGVGIIIWQINCPWQSDAWLLIAAIHIVSTSL